ncbi:hypothetical protein GGU10DRAFT_84178 [Lentinula aff. detonsa]|uniref:Uncharacterized protein n=1 Tax=Lentinula aff. detonsa TaxID=2804958 RepID=A0AA38NJY8_9AGAR|nr:hypothetical protein GGU10DRAFT_84178 [Lentinula aff. detonsa]
MSEDPSKEAAAIEKAFSGAEPSLAKTAGAVATEPVAVNDDEGEESDTYDDFDHEENQDNDGFEEDEDDEEGVSGEPPNKSSLTALLIGNPSAPNNNFEVDPEEEEEDDTDDDDEFQGDEDEEDDDDTYIPSQSNSGTTNGKKRSISEADGYSEEAQTKKAKA